MQRLTQSWFSVTDNTQIYKQLYQHQTGRAKKIEMLLIAVMAGHAFKYGSWYCVYKRNILPLIFCNCYILFTNINFKDFSF